jgi:hypothetical protein
MPYNGVAYITGSVRNFVTPLMVNGKTIATTPAGTSLGQLNNLYAYSDGGWLPIYIGPLYLAKGATVYTRHYDGGLTFTAYPFGQ